jgi:2,3-bisphosphoglycerate-dependent phosphoglycerate mutase
MHLYFIRHAQSVNNAIWDNTGSSEGWSVDSGLSDVGWQQARILADCLSQRDPNLEPEGRDLHYRTGFRVTHLYTSLTVRAVATGSLLAQALNLDLVGWADLRESDGAWSSDDETGERTVVAGKDRGFFETNFPQLVLPNTPAETAWWERPFEEPKDPRGRARRFLDDLWERHGNTKDRVAVISHGNFYDVVMHTLLHTDRKYDFYFTLHNTGITRIDMGEQGNYVVYSNRVDHLPAHLVT